MEAGAGTTVVGAGRLAVEAPGKYDPVAPLLGALAGPAPDAPEDPLRLFIRQVARVRIMVAASGADVGFTVAVVNKVVIWVSVSHFF